MTMAVIVGLKSCLNPLEIGSNCNEAYLKEKQKKWGLNPLEIGSNCNIIMGIYPTKRWSLNPLEIGSNCNAIISAGVNGNIQSQSP